MIEELSRAVLFGNAWVFYWLAAWSVLATCVVLERWMFFRARRGDTDNGRELPWQALGENAAAQSTAKDLAGALYGIVAKHAEPEDLLFAMLNLHRKDASNAFKAAMQAFGLSWDSLNYGAEKVPA